MNDNSTHFSTTSSTAIYINRFAHSVSISVAHFHNTKTRSCRPTRRVSWFICSPFIRQAPLDSLALGILSARIIVQSLTITSGPIVKRQARLISMRLCHLPRRGSNSCGFFYRRWLSQWLEFSVACMWIIFYFEYILQLALFAECIRICKSGCTCSLVYLN